MSSNADLPHFPFARENGYEPSPVNARLRHDAPISKTKLFDGSEAWMVMRHKDICTALDSDKLSADRRVDGYPEIHPGGSKAKESNPTFVNLDDPEHAKQRAMLQSRFDPEAVEKMRPMMQETTNEILDELVKKGGKDKPVDLIEEFATPLPTQIIYKMLGVPEKDVGELSTDSDVRTGTSRDAAESANKHLQEYMSKLVDQRIEKPEDDLISKLVVEQDDITTLAFLVLTAGNAALINSIGLGVLTLLQHPDQLEELKRDPNLAPAVVNEVLRFHTASALNSRRVAKEDMTIGGQHIKKHEGVICSVQSGDRDEEKAPNPDEFDIHRKVPYEDILGFGHGPHRCQGEHLSRAELEIAFGTLFQRVPNLKLAVKESELEWTPATQNVGVKELPVYF
ncbi:hypothetical protein H2203_008811 [Taxawa tesnikishii (nom. ined.)]|nr:hypothetical protein H2203_008811 [Dothideales sp. JES 119]